MLSVALAVAMACSVLCMTIPRVDRLPKPNADRTAVQRLRSHTSLTSLSSKLHSRMRRDKRRKAANELVSAVAAELRAGQPARTALARASAVNPERIGARAAAVANLGGDVPTALDEQAESDHLPELRALAALWRVADGSGAGLARACDRLAISLADAQRVRGELASQLAGPRATARVLAALPLFGIALGNMLGAAPLPWLFGTRFGLIALVIGLLLEAVGLWWIHRLTQQVADRA